MVLTVGLIHIVTQDVECISADGNKCGDQNNDFGYGRHDVVGALKY